ncbi:hypothetical protein GJU40_08160 [Bacillus lacus]|uniref:Uncharacterized protein n=1 Tax=Metabacillus lacus TaxID=1983721 RepID=A0A7X2IYT2_9BACI|nr:hypothetical protein [Metabacillus lacus]MRX72134.1 hypothetical protein [Metabacillus lacus]
MEKKSRRKSRRKTREAGEKWEKKAGEIQDVWTKFLMSKTMKSWYKFEKKWGRRGTTCFFSKR